MTTYREKLEATAQLLRTPPQSVCRICPGPRIPSPAHAAVVGRKGLHPVRGVLRAWFSWDRAEPGWRKGLACREPCFMLPSYPAIAYTL